jgi:hypothetical protein
MWGHHQGQVWDHLDREGVYVARLQGIDKWQKDDTAIVYLPLHAYKWFLALHRSNQFNSE